MLLTFGQLIDKLEKGQIAESEDGRYKLINDNGVFLWYEDYGVFNKDSYVQIVPKTRMAKWRITGFERKKCKCCGAELK